MVIEEWRRNHTGNQMASFSGAASIRDVSFQAFLQNKYTNSSTK